MVYIYPIPGNMSSVTPDFLLSVSKLMFFLIWTKFKENLSIGYVLVYLTITSLIHFICK